MISTKPSPSFLAQKAFMIVVCIGLGVWGAYDLWIKIPHRIEQSKRYEELTGSLKQIEAARISKASRGEQPTDVEIAEYQRINSELTAIAPGGKVPTPPSKFDHVVQWIYISSIPFGIWPIFTLLNVKKQRYALQDDGSLHFQGDKELGAGVWQQDEIADIDMGRWMAKSIAWLVHSDGKRLKLDAYLHKHLDEIVGTFAHQFHPDAWQPDAKPVKAIGNAEAREAEMSENVATGGIGNGDSSANP